MTQRNEPTVGNSAFDISSFFGGKKEVVKTPEQLLNEALKGFTDAQANLETAEESHSRLERIKGRFADLLA